MRASRFWVASVVGCACALLLPAVALAAGDVRVSVGSPASPFPQNKQNEPAVAIDAHAPSVVVAGANDEIDLQPCPESAPANDIRCPFTPGVGVSGVYFSFNGGRSWTQPTYRGWTARDCTATSCTPHVGPIGTLPGYYESGLASDGDPNIAFGPRPRNGHFSWSNGSRLYYVNLAAAFPGQAPFRGFEAIAVSRTDNVRGAARGQNSAWMRPVIVSQRQSATTFADKNDIWADNAASSRFFGNVYVCFTHFRSQQAAGPEPIVVTRSTDGGATWRNQRQLTSASNAHGHGRQGCTVRTDSRGTVYVFWEGGNPHGASQQMMARSFDGGVTWTRPTAIAQVVDVGVFDPVLDDVFFDGVAGARTDSYPSADVANGAPTGVGATDEIVVTWADARAGLNHEQAPIAYSTDHGDHWNEIANAAQAGDRPDFPAIAISPSGQRVYVTYDGFLTPYRQSTSQARLFQGVVRAAGVGAGGAPSGFATLHRGAVGDARGSSTNSLVEEFLGDYNDVSAADSYAVAVWNDARNAAVCGAVDAFRQSLYTAQPLPAPWPGGACPGRFGNVDIFGGQYR